MVAELFPDDDEDAVDLLVDLFVVLLPACDFCCGTFGTGGISFVDGRVNLFKLFSDSLSPPPEALVPVGDRYRFRNKPSPSLRGEKPVGTRGVDDDDDEGVLVVLLLPASVADDRLDECDVGLF